MTDPSLLEICRSNWIILGAIFSFIVMIVVAVKHRLPMIVKDVKTLQETAVSKVFCDNRHAPLCKKIDDVRDRLDEMDSDRDKAREEIAGRLGNIEGQLKIIVDKL
jgi:hypothetical protein